nr:probable nicotinate phosphoribosyltransferase [Quercus suber]POF15555.1 nicotinate phosphoribosyltransferase [Quercus suber]
MAETPDDMASTPPPEGIFSILDTDLYKLTMQCAVLQHFPDVPVAYKFTNRTPHMRLNRGAYDWLQAQVHKLADVKLTADELTWLRKTCPYFGDPYLRFLESFTFRPAEHLHLTFTETPDHADPASGDLDISIRGRWVDTILYEIPLLALVSEAYFKFVDRAWTHAGQRERAERKGAQLLSQGCAFSEFGTRRRRDYTTHALVLQGLVAAAAAASQQQQQQEQHTGSLTGTSNVHMARRFHLTPIGTVAHEWIMGIAAVTRSPATANATALHLWLSTYGAGVLGVALTDTFGTPSFLDAFAQQPPSTSSTEGDADASSYAHIFTGVRQDSGDPLIFITRMRDFYARQGLLSGGKEGKKSVVFSDALDVEKCVRYRRAAIEAGLKPSFGIGTFFTNDFEQHSTSGGNDERRGEGKSEGKKSPPLNIVIKLSEAQGRPAVKLSDDVGKNMGEGELVERIKREVGYEDEDGSHRWEGGDEAHRWDG